MPAPPKSPVKPTPNKPVAKVPKKAPETMTEKIDAVIAGEMTFAQAMGLTRTEAYGIAFSAHRMFEHGQTARAKKMLDGLMVANPKDAYFPTLLGAIYGREGDDDEAKKLYDLACKLDPKNLTARVNRADLLLRRGDLAAALEDLIAAARLDQSGKTPQGKRAIALARSTSAALHDALRARKNR